MMRAFNAKSSAARRLAGGGAEPVADGVWRVRGGVPREMNVYLIEDDGGGVTVFDAGVRSMAKAITAAGAGLGGINRVVLGHAHVDHRGAAGRLGAPVHCHPDERADAEGDAGRHYMRPRAGSRRTRALVYPPLLRMWDGGPVEIAGTVAEGEDVSGFRAVHLPGHAPGMIALFRERDGVALTTDAFYTLDIQTGLHGPPRVAHAAFNQDTEQARASIRKLAGAAARARPGPVTPSRSGATSRRSSSAPRRADGQAQPPPRAPPTRCRRRSPSTAAPRGDVLVLRGAMTPATRREYAAAAGGGGWRRSRARTPGSAPSSSCSSAWPCAGRSPAPTRSRSRRSCWPASGSRAPDERRWIRDVLREHLAEHFPELDAP